MQVGLQANLVQHRMQVIMCLSKKHMMQSSCLHVPGLLGIAVFLWSSCRTPYMLCESTPSQG